MYGDLQTGARAPGGLKHGTGAEAAVRTLIAAGVDTCFANPGTSEMHFVSALDRIEGICPVLALHESVATGAADGFGRMARRPASTLLHAGPGLLNGASNLHNARRAGTPLLSIVGDHATYHRPLDAPLTTDLETIATTCSDRVIAVRDTAELAELVAEAATACMDTGGQVVSLLLPADMAWSPAAEPFAEARVPKVVAPDWREVEKAAAALARAGERGALVLGGRALSDDALAIADTIRQATGARLLTANLVPRLSRGAGSFLVDYIPYAVDEAIALLACFDTLVMVDAHEPVAFFAYPGKPSRLAPESCALQYLVKDGSAALAALADLAIATSATRYAPSCIATEQPSPGAGFLTPEGLSRSIAAFMPQGTILVEESVSAGRALGLAMDRSRGHEVLRNMGGSIGFGLPAAVGAAIACPDRKVVCIEADGSGMYTQQALWTCAREGLDVLIVILANRKYQILQAEMRNVQAAQTGARARRMLEIDSPAIDWVRLAGSMGVDAAAAQTMEEFNPLFEAMKQPGTGPFLIEALY